MANNIAFIPIRSGSLGISNKNIKDFCGKPLVYWVTKAASDCELIGDVYVAVDCDEYEKIIRDFNLPNVFIFRRDFRTAQSNSTTEQVLLEFTNKLFYVVKDRIVLLQATSPLTTSQDLTNALNEFDSSHCDSMLSVVTFKRFFWRKSGVPYNYVINERPLRQQWEGTLLENGSFYVNSVENIMKDRCRLSGKVYTYVLPEWHQYEIDGTEDWKVMENIFRENILKYQKSDHVEKIKLVYIDVDGTLTDGKVIVDERGNEYLTFSKLDGHGIQLLRKKGIKIIWATSEADVSAIRHRAKKLQINYFIYNEHDKLRALRKLCEQENISFKEIAAIGDDVNDYEVLNSTGLKACPADAHSAIKNISNIIILSKDGGKGAVREFIDDFILKSY